MTVIRETNFQNLGTLKTGKVRDIYIQPERLILIATDRHSSFDRIIAHVPDKGAILNLSSAFWFAATQDIIPNHVIAVPDPNVLVAKKLKPLPVEAVVRGYLTGTTSTAIWTRYSAGERVFGGVTLPDGMKKNAPLPEAIFDPTTKEDAHDRTLTQEELVAEGFITPERLAEVKSTALALFARGQEVAADHGLILVDTKYEFGLDDEGQLTLIDEIHTPDSSRYWQAASFGARLEKGEEPEYFDKEFLRLWFRDHCDPYKDAVLPEAPAEMVAELSRRYHALFEQLTGEALVLDKSLPPLERMEKALKPYTV
ncbi:phosphoribosylaminoimidazole-succinocarboxamide synthase [Rhizomicrobium palustre]|uniref:Phosphoribosylaminoimidazole-succinocarboxamide synthase n=1 Tax=Rhizomicrobium palustre TaxID=189966 RepID=A0A846N3D8_9PROT|nr:phosphoribosylaminoimidazolesuccinocarboxamide synthase [Rhizomicrobium palustre]NIK89732.1 phosphoribosylaminoimidazole-succinocarboxamide synthase [Rhizomicrobium palustre]